MAHEIKITYDSKKSSLQIDNDAKVIDTLITMEHNLHVLKTEFSQYLKKSGLYSDDPAIDEKMDQIKFSDMRETFEHSPFNMANRQEPQA